MYNSSWYYLRSDVVGFYPTSFANEILINGVQTPGEPVKIGYVGSPFSGVKRYNVSIETVNIPYPNTTLTTVLNVTVYGNEPEP